MGVSLRQLLAWSLCASAFVLGMSASSGIGETVARFDGPNKLGFQLLLRLIQEESQTPNFVISPLSIELALGMVYAGATGSTASAIAETLGWSGTSREQIIRIEAELQDSLKATGQDVVLHIANAIWIDEGTKLQPEFSQVIEHGFGGEIFSRSFSKAGISDEINRWVAQRTEGKSLR